MANDGYSLDAYSVIGALNQGLQAANGTIDESRFEQASHRWCSQSIGAVVGELQMDVEVFLLDHRNDALQVVALLGADTHLISLD